LKGAYKALNRRISKKTQEGELDIKVGKDPLRFGFYRFLSRRLLHSKADLLMSILTPLFACAFVGYPMEIKGILRFCLASLIYHMSFLR